MSARLTSVGVARSSRFRTIDSVSSAFHLLICCLVLVPWPRVVAGGEAVAAPSANVLNDLSSDQVDVVNHAVELFGDAGLRLPPLVITASDDDGPCGGTYGVHRRHAWGSEIMLCSARTDEWFRRVVLHELAHAWSEFGLTAERREAFRLLRDWDHWMNYELAEWRDNGAEQAAEVIAWGVSDRAAPTVQIAEDSCADLRTGYVTLTGVEPPHGITSLCGPQRGRIAVS